MTRERAPRVRLPSRAWFAAVSLAAVGLAIWVQAWTATSSFAKDPPTSAPPPSFGFWLRRVAPWMDENCAACHRASGAGTLRLLAPPLGPAGEKDLARREAEFGSVVRSLDREAPWRSRLLLKVLPEEGGGLPHVGGPFLREADDFYDELLDFASGATLENLPPEPEPGKDRRVKPGERVELDGSPSYDRDDDPVSFLWQLAVKPAGSQSTLQGERDPKSSFVPDMGGTYVAKLRVFDGKVWSAARTVVLEALERVGPETPDPVAPSGLEAVDPATLKRLRAVYGDVLGRPPTPPESIASATKSHEALAQTLVRTAEAGRAWFEDAAFRLGLVGDHEPVSETAAALPFRWAAGELSPGAAEAILVADPSFARAHPRGDEAAVLRLLLDREPKPNEVESLRLPRGLVELSRSAEFATAALRRHVARYLPPAAALAFPTSRAGESGASLSTWLLGCPEWAGGGAARGADDLAFVRAVFADLLGRRPSTGELAAVTRAVGVLPGSPAGRAAVVDVLLDSGEVLFPLLVDLKNPDAWLADRFLRYLGRHPTSEEAKAYRAALMDPDGGPHLVVRALLTSPEYASR